MALLVTLFLMLVNVSTSATAHSPTSEQINALQIWLLNCIVFVFLALMEYAVILYLKNMRGVKNHVFHSGILVVTPSPEPEKDCWINQQTECLEARIKLLDFLCVVVFPVLFLAFNAIYWSLQYSSIFGEIKNL